jgi:hypothetical protein
MPGYPTWYSQSNCTVSFCIVVFLLLLQPDNRSAQSMICRRQVCLAEKISRFVLPLFLFVFGMFLMIRLLSFDMNECRRYFLCVSHFVRTVISDDSSQIVKYRYMWGWLFITTILPGVPGPAVNQEGVIDAGFPPSEGLYYCAWCLPSRVRHWPSAVRVTRTGYRRSQWSNKRGREETMMWCCYRSSAS